MSNEKSFDKSMSTVLKKNDMEQESQLQVYVEPSSCKTKEAQTGEFCEWNPHIPIRFYEVKVKAIDNGGNVASANATVVIVPKENKDDHSATKQFEEAGLHNDKYFEHLIAKERERFVLETAAMEWVVA